ncbi:NADP-dependent oxidoreductase domain-containing protein [Protomyces lactucae-debilis]|uniref:NADP-dependent oxidoreductase domain-containing protein n=1 Tax=Protomyces lactucae-debilis TaxID=2754530 RepID=A0A1Y2EPD9_PROLT|nr:NADP-dependent oxidoreductase domain-containing protein [Protomyces lactucae-debilis]ORY73388.1 NADP-dependent oxidoreductase domain-containing protein [Protomyces lactucae-debilis]
MPQLGARKGQRAVRISIGAGYRHIDAAWIYGNEQEVGEGIKAGMRENNLKRSDLWITSKLWNIFHDPKHVKGAVQESLAKLGVDYLDLYLMHWPVAFEYQGNDKPAPRNEAGKTAVDKALTDDPSPTWRAMEELVESGLVRNIGISNFCPSRIEQLLKSAKITPAVNQVELHPYLAQPKLLEYCKEKGIHLTAYSPLGSQDSDLLQDKTVLSIAEKHGVDAGRVLIAWGLTRGTSVIPKSVTPSRIRNNFQAQDVKLSEEDLAALAKLDKAHRFVNPRWGLDIYRDGESKL